MSFDISGRSTEKVRKWDVISGSGSWQRFGVCDRGMRKYLL